VESLRDELVAESTSERDEYELLARLEEQPLDPRKARISDFCMIPGFSVDLAERLVELRTASGSLREIVSRLTPPERDVLYRFEPYLLLPGRKGWRRETRITLMGIGHGQEQSWDLRADLRSDRCRILARAQPDDVYRFYLSNSCCRGYLRLHAGDFTPDLAWGLVSSSYHSSYPFSGGYYIRRSRWIAGTSSFYGPSLRGGAVEAWTAFVRLLFFRGDECSYYSGRFSSDGEPLTGFRCEARSRSASLGFSVCSGERLPERRAIAADFALEEGAVEMQCELALFGDDAFAGIFALAAHGAEQDIRLIFMGNGLISASRYGRSFHGRSGPKRGLSVAVKRRIGHRIELLSVFERWSSWNGKRSERGDLIRLELRRRSRVSETKLSYSLRRDTDHELMPYPPGRDEEINASSSASLLQSFRLNRSTRLRISVRVPIAEDHGVMVAPSILLDHPIKVSISYARHRSVRGGPTFYLYEPTVRGFYPWHALRKNGWRISALCEVSIGMVRLACGYMADSRKEREGIAQLSIKL
jgi:hypothetical protein